MACNPVSEREITVLTSDGRISYIEVGTINNNGIPPENENYLRDVKLPSPPLFSLESLLPGILNHIILKSFDLEGYFSQ